MQTSSDIEPVRLGDRVFFRHSDIAHSIGSFVKYQFSHRYSVLAAIN